MKLPDFCKPIKTGQVWRKKSNDILYVITGGARNRQSQKAYHMRRYDMKVRIAHAIAEKDLWRFYEFIGNDTSVPEYVLWSELKKQL